MFAKVAVAILLAAPLAAQSPAPGTYSDSQAVRGQQWYESSCAACHPSRDMSSPDFQMRWRGRTAFDLFDRMRTTMPLTAPGTLSRRTYTDIVAYLMKINGLPAGTTALASDSTVLRETLLSFSGTPSTTNGR